MPRRSTRPEVDFTGVHGQPHLEGLVGAVELGVGLLQQGAPELRLAVRVDVCQPACRYKEVNTDKLKPSLSFEGVKVIAMLMSTVQAGKVVVHNHIHPLPVLPEPEPRQATLVPWQALDTGQWPGFVRYV